MIEKYLKDKTYVIVTHRPKLKELCNKHYLFDNHMMKEVITIEEFLERIKKYYNEEIYIELEGDIRGEIKTKLNEVKIYRNVIQIIYDRSKRNFFGEKLEINIYKIEKIESDEDTEFYIY